MIDWSKMSPEEVLGAIRSAPRIAGPWHKSEDGLHELRDEILPGRIIGIAAWVGDDDRDSSDYETDAPYPDRESADTALLAAGWVLSDAAPFGAFDLPLSLDKR
jgi:hypothetical protein